jgi:hypothetical protein
MGDAVTARRKRGKHRGAAADAPGVVAVRLTAADEGAAGYLARLIRDDLHTEIITAPRRLSGGRLYFTARVRRDGESK